MRPKRIINRYRKNSRSKWFKIGGGKVMVERYNHFRSHRKLAIRRTIYQFKMGWIGY